MATLVPIIVTGSWVRPDNTTPTGKVTFQLLRNILEPVVVAAFVQPAVLSSGAIAQQLWATDLDSDGDPIFPSTLLYQVTEQILGAPDQLYYIRVPAVPPGSRTIDDAVLVLSSQLMSSADANFTDDDQDAYVLLPQVPPGTQIVDVIDEHTVQLSAAASANAVAVTVLIGASASLQELRPD